MLKVNYTCNKTVLNCDGSENEPIHLNKHDIDVPCKNK